ncbi:MAG: hypothetical protein KG003_01065 [Bacteroidetes bacterium]|nr:hypothetical protein [Bacteroidota bacterium]
MKLRIFNYLTIGMLFILVLLDVIICTNFICKNDYQLKDFGIAFSIVSSSIGILFVALTYFFNRESNERTQIEKYFTYLNSDINDASFKGQKGVDAYLLFDLKNSENNIILDNLNLVLSSFETYLNLIDNNKLVSKSFKKFSATRLHLLFYSKVLWPLNETIIKHGHDFITKMHDDSKITIPKFARLGIRCIQYLKENGLAQNSNFKDEIIKSLKELISHDRKAQK